MAISLEDLEIAPMEAFDMYAYLGLVRVMEPQTEMLMQERADDELVSDEYDSPHSRPWFVSFHGSEFPGVPVNACKRYLTYRMMNFPATSSMPPWVTVTGTLGKAGELDIADAWYKGGGLLAIPESSEEEASRLSKAIDLILGGQLEQGQELAERAKFHQLGFVDPEVWMTVSTDLPILPFGWRRPHIVEVKCKADDVVQEMIQGRLIQHVDGRIEKVGRGPDEKHTVQLKATLGAAHEYDWGSVSVCPQCWFVTAADIFERLIGDRQHPRSDHLQYCPRCADYTDTLHFDLEQPTTGEVYYWSRSWPRTTKSFYYEHDQGFIDTGKAILAEAKAHYIADELPPRPEHFQWSIGPCEKCNFKPFCRLDSGVAPRKRKVDTELERHTLTGSHGVDHARSMRPSYDPQAVRDRVHQEWLDD